MATVLFDMFGVIARVQSADSINEIQTRAGRPGQAFWDQYWRLRPPYDRGELKGPEYWRKVAKALGVTFSDRQITSLIEADLASWSEVDEDCVELIGSLRRRGVRLGLLSNIPHELADHYEANHPWLGQFDVLGFSCRIGWAKPDPRAYGWCRDALGVAASDILFVDDQAKNTAAAESCGMRSHQFTSVAALAAALEREVL